MPQQHPPILPRDTKEKDANAVPTAVALHYTGNGAPRVVAKGKGEVAQQIIALAHEHGVPLDDDPGLAGALSQIDLGKEIPRDLYRAVAHVLAFAWHLKGKRPVR